MPQRLIICMTGTSFIREVPAEPRQGFEARVRAKLDERRATKANRAAFLKLASAEANGLLRLNCCGDDIVNLVVSDTENGRISAALLAEFIRREFSAEVAILPVKDLQVSEPHRFARHGVRNLFETLDRAIRAGRDRGLTPVLNLTGGFKSMAAFATVYAMVREIPAHYAYEYSDELLNLPLLPLTFDWNRLTFAANALLALRDQGGIMPWSEFVALLPHHGYGDDAGFAMLVEHEGDLAIVAAAGLLMFDRLEQEERRTQVLLSPSAWREAKGESGVGVLVKRALANLRNPLLRALPAHRHRHGNSDCLVWKEQGVSAPRLLWWEDGGVVYVAEILPNHDAYDRKVEKGPGVWRKDFDAGGFRPL